jgi:hypothetical protein
MMVAGMTLREQYKAQCERAHIASEFQHTPLAVVLCRWPGVSTRVVVQGGVVCGAVWERQAKQGARFRVLAVFKCGRQIAGKPYGGKDRRLWTAPCQS